MKEIKLFYLEHCPYCKHARRALEELLSESPAYGEIQVNWIEESKVTADELDGSYDYYYVPTIFYGEEKLYEASPAHSYGDIRENIERAFQSISKG